MGVSRDVTSFVTKRHWGQGRGWYLILSVKAGHRWLTSLLWTNMVSLGKALSEFPCPPLSPSPSAVLWRVKVGGGVRGAVVLGQRVWHPCVLPAGC